MKILHIGKYYYPEKGGIETVLKNLAEAQTSNGHEVTVCCSSGNISASKETINGVKVVRLFTPLRLFSQPLSFGFFYYIWKNSNSFDVINLHSPNPLAELAVLLFSKNRNLVDSHHSDIVKQKYLKYLYRPFQNAMLRRMHKIIVATKFHHIHSEILTNYNEKIAVIPYGINSDRFADTNKISEFSILRRKEYGPFILFVGRLVAYKGVKYLVQAMKHLEISLVIVGDGPELPSLKAEASNAKLTDKIHFLTDVDDDIELLGLYSACDIFVLPSISPNEAFGMVMLEAMYFAKPLVSTDIKSGVSFVNKDEVNGITVHAESGPEIAQAVKKILSNKDLYDKFSESSKKRFHSEFDVNVMQKKYEQVYTNINV